MTDPCVYGMLLYTTVVSLIMRTDRWVSVELRGILVGRT